MRRWECKQCKVRMNAATKPECWICGTDKHVVRIGIIMW